MRKNTNPAAGAPTPPAAYRSTNCRVGTHDECTEAQREKDRPQPVEGVRYETCTCGCHDWRGADH